VDSVDIIKRIFEVFPMVVDSVLKDVILMLESVPSPVLTELIASCATDKLLPDTVDIVDNPSPIVLPKLLRPIANVDI